MTRRAPYLLKATSNGGVRRGVRGQALHSTWQSWISSCRPPLDTPQRSTELSPAPFTDHSSASGAMFGVPRGGNRGSRNSCATDWHSPQDHGRCIAGRSHLRTRWPGDKQAVEKSYTFREKFEGLPKAAVSPLIYINIFLWLEFCSLFVPFDRSAPASHGAGPTRRKKSATPEKKCVRDNYSPVCWPLRRCLR